MQNFPYRAALVLSLVLPGHVAQSADPVPIETVAVADGLHMLLGRGGNVAVSTGPDGTFVVDDQYAGQYDGLKAAIAELSSSPVKFLINTHWHNDHSGGNEQMSASGAVIVAHENVRTRLSTDQLIEFFHADVPASPRAALPVITFTTDLALHLNGDTMRVFHVDNAHTDGDAVVHFTQANVIHTGDVFFNGRYPFIDTGSGGSMRGMIAAVETILARCDERTRIIPGHGPLSDKQGLQEYLAMLKATRQAVADLIVGGSTEEQAVLAQPTKAHDTAWGGGFLKPDTYVRMIYNDIKRSTLP